MLLTGEIYKLLDKSIDKDDSEFDEVAFDDVMKRLKSVKSKNKQNMQDQLERVLAVTNVVRFKNKINLDPKHTLAKEIINQSIVIDLKDRAETLWFKPKNDTGSLLKPVIVLKKGKTSVMKYSEGMRSRIAVRQYKELIKQYYSNAKTDTPPSDRPIVDERDGFPLVNTYVDILYLRYPI